ncbi:DUF4114 domain-containing protein [Methylobacillus arboreus]|uniref:PEP-CTERM sorting domain-containing protein n=1 Tax=Methylobacillus arboreus TaxID=755170 RepID=UPI001E4CEE32|nr:PEP-CTERM sorting domain-containing protein [Methylobacillus arboreus]MCB5191510.1 DUF4114 domain-containing protein [Methylobacillus arboreus]
MRAMVAKLVPLLVVAGIAAPSAQAAEPTLADILQGVEATSWTQIDYADFIGGSWNQVGQQLTFTFVAEHTAHAATQEFWLDATFTPDPYGYSSVIFSGADVPGATLTVTLESVASRILFNSSINADQLAPGGDAGDLQVWLSASGTYALAYEDWIYGGSDYNDFVVTVSAVPEPANLAMLLAGLGLLGVAARRKRK